MFPLVNLTRVSMAAHSMYFPSLFQLGSPLILVTAPGLCRVIVPFYSHCRRYVLGSRSLLVVYVFTSSNSLRGPPLNKGHWPKVRHETSVLEVPAQEQHEHGFCSSFTNTFITCPLYTVRRYHTSPGAPDLRAGLG